jgi:hypothetical protein
MQICSFEQGKKFVCKSEEVAISVFIMWLLFSCFARINIID